MSTSNKYYIHNSNLYKVPDYKDINKIQHITKWDGNNFNITNKVTEKQLLKEGEFVGVSHSEAVKQYIKAITC